MRAKATDDSIDRNEAWFGGISFGIDQSIIYLLLVFYLHLLRFV